MSTTKTTQYRTGTELVVLDGLGVNWSSYQYEEQTGEPVPELAVGNLVRLLDIPRSRIVIETYPGAVGARVVDTHADGTIHMDILAADGHIIGEETRSSDSMRGVIARSNR